MSSKEDLNWTISLKPSSFSEQAESTYYEVNPRKRVDKKITKEQTQAGLTAGGFVPGPVGIASDLANSLISLSDLEFYDAAANLVSAIPGFGDAIGVSMKGSKRAISATGDLLKGGGVLGSDVDKIVRDYEPTYPFLPTEYQPGYNLSRDSIEEKLTSRGIMTDGSITGGMHKTLNQYIDLGDEPWEDEDSHDLGEKFGNINLTKDDLSLYKAYLSTLDLPERPSTNRVLSVKG